MISNNFTNVISTKSILIFPPIIIIERFLIIILINLRINGIILLFPMSLLVHLSPNRRVTTVHETLILCRTPEFVVCEYF